jgi:hypothetical protein
MLRMVQANRARQGDHKDTVGGERTARVMTLKRRGERSFSAAAALMEAAAAFISSGVRGSRGCATA